MKRRTGALLAWILFVPLGIAVPAPPHIERAPVVRDARLPGGPGGPLRSRYTLRLEDLERLQHRLVVDFPGLRLFALERLEGLEVIERRLGVALPFAALGPLTPSGLWRKIHNPLAHGPGSTAHREPTGLRLDASLAGTSRRGAAVRVPAGGAEGFSGGMMISESPATALQAGAWIGHSALEGLRPEALAACSMPPADSEQSSWVLDGAPYPGGGLAHAAAALQAGSPPASLSWAGALSGGALVAPGAFSDLELQLYGPRGDLILAGGLCSPAYRRPDGRENRRVAQGGLRVELTVGGAERRGVQSPRRRPFGTPWSVRAELGTAAERPSPAVLAGASGWDLQQGAAAAVTVERRLAAGTVVRLRGEGAGELRLPACGGIERRCSLKVILRAERGGSGLEGELEVRVGPDGEETHRLVLAGRRALGLGLRGEVARDSWVLFADLHTRKDLWIDGGLWGACGSPIARDPWVEPRGRGGGQGAAFCAPGSFGLTVGWDVRARGGVSDGND